MNIPTNHFFTLNSIPDAGGRFQVVGDGYAVGAQIAPTMVRIPGESAADRATIARLAGRPESTAHIALQLPQPLSGNGWISVVVYKAVIHH